MVEQRKNNIFEEGVASKDASLPLEQLLSNMKDEAEKVKEVKKETAPVVKEKELSPLEQLKREKEKVQGGIVVSNEELEKGKIQIIR